MKASRSSSTAEQMALSRALETRKPAAERICNDPFAERFLGVKYRLLLLSRPLRNAVEQAIEAMFAGHHHYVLARTRYIEDFLLDQLKGDCRQLVILGAGYDSRAARFAEQLKGVVVFEIDHPATSRLKQAKVQGFGAGVQSAVRYVPVDFNVDSLGEKLKENGYRDGQKTVFLWEGVTPYVSAQGVNATLQFVASSAAPGSAILFDYVLESVLAGTCTLRGAANEFNKMAKTSEPFVFGLVPESLPAYLAQRGYRDVVDVGAEELKQRYFGGARSEQYVKPWWRIVYARTV